MTVPVQDPFTASTANGVTTVFPYGFKIAAAEDLVVTIDDVIQTTGYTVSGVGSPSGGNVTFDTAPADGAEVIRYLDPVLKRDTDYQQFGDWRAQNVNLDFDRIWLALRSMKQLATRAIKMRVNTTDDQVITEAPADRALKVIGFDALGKLKLYIAQAGTSLIDLGASAGSSLVGVVQAGVNAVARTVEYELRQSVKITQFGAEPYPTGTSAGNSVAIQKAIEFIEARGGGKLRVPFGNYLVQKNSITHSAPGISLVIEGDGPKASVITCDDATVGFVFKSNVPASNTASFTMRDIGINGPGGAAPAGIGLHLQGSHNQARIENVYFNGLNTCMQLEGVFMSVFSGLHFRNYYVGIKGDDSYVALPSQNNVFEGCYFSYGPTADSAVPIASFNMGYNTYISCDFEASGYQKYVDMRGGAGHDTMIGCRFERMNSGAWPYLIPGNFGRYINCTFHSTDAVPARTAPFIDCYGSGYGIGNTFDGVPLSNTTAMGTKFVRFQAGTRQNSIKFAPLSSSETWTMVYGLVEDIGDGDNTVEYPGGGRQTSLSSGGVVTEGGGLTNQWIMDSLGMSLFTFDGLTNSTATGNGNPGVGPFAVGYSRDLNTPTGNKKCYFSLSASNTYVYIFSIFVLPKTAGDTIDIAFDTSLASPTWRTITLNDTNKWQRVFIAVKASSTATHYAQLRANGASGVYVAAPQIEEIAYTRGRFGPAGYIPSSVATGGQNYIAGNHPYPIGKKFAYGTAAPTKGRWTNGDIIWNLDTAAAGVPGWICVASGIPGTWKAMAAVAA